MLAFVTDRWFPPHFSVLARFRIGAWMADVACPVACQPVWPACWMDTPDRFSSSVARTVQDSWGVYREELGLVPPDVVLAPRDEAGLFRAYCRAGGPTEAGSAAFLGRGLLRIRSRRLGGRAVGRSGASRLYRVRHGNEVDVTSLLLQYYTFAGVLSLLLMS